MATKKTTKKSIEQRIKELEADERRVALELGQLEYETLSKKAECAKIVHEIEKLNVLKEFGEEY